MIYINSRGAILVQPRQEGRYTHEDTNFSNWDFWKCLRNVYEVKAETPEQALRFLKDGMEPYNPVQQTIHSTIGEAGHRVIANF